MNAVKTKTELGRLKIAAKITKDIHNTIARRVKPGVSEMEIAETIDSIIKRKGLKRSFKTIVASGSNGAKPHAKVTKRKIQKNDVVVIDFGVIYRDYYSDMTRTIVLGRANKRLKKLYNVVKFVQQKAIKKVRSGLIISDFVKEIHGYIRLKGLGKYIYHSLGHGVGRKIHEAPKLSEKNNGKFKKNMVITIEPGLYIKGLGGVRIEDMVQVKSNSAKVITR